MKMTPWFKCSTPPSREGWYDIQYGGSYANGNSVIKKKRLYFKNGKWLMKKKGGESDFAFNDMYKKLDKWRGLAEQPK